MDLPQIGDKWQHYKGGVYEITGIARAEDDMSLVILYSKYDYVWTRSLRDFTTFVEVDANNKPVQRFTKVNV